MDENLRMQAMKIAAENAVIAGNLTEESRSTQASIEFRTLKATQANVALLTAINAQLLAMDELLLALWERNG